jgi:hypothetical protein
MATVCPTIRLDRHVVPAEFGVESLGKLDPGFGLVRGLAPERGREDQGNPSASRGRDAGRHRIEGAFASGDPIVKFRARPEERNLEDPEAGLDELGQALSEKSSVRLDRDREAILTRTADERGEIIIEEGLAAGEGDGERPDRRQLVEDAEPDLYRKVGIEVLSSAGMIRA